MRHILNKPVNKMYGDQFVRISAAERADYVTVKLGMLEARAFHLLTRRGRRCGLTIRNTVTASLQPLEGRVSSNTSLSLHVDCAWAHSAGTCSISVMY